MKITDLRTVAVRVPVERPTAIATRQLGAREYILVWIDTDDGHNGVLPLPTAPGIGITFDEPAIQRRQKA